MRRKEKMKIFFFYWRDDYTDSKLVLKKSIIITQPN